MKGEADRCYSPITAVMTVDRVALATLRVLQVKEKRRYVGSLPRYFTSFSERSGRTPQILRPNFHSLSNKSMSSKKSTPLLADAQFTPAEMLVVLSLRVLSCPPERSLTCIPAELRLH